MRPTNSKYPEWVPPHCPNPGCRFHTGETRNWQFKRAGYYSRRMEPRRIQRFTCRHCGRSFSTQTFSASYWQKLPDLDRRIFMRTIGCMSNRQIARDIGVSHETVSRHLRRLGRHCLLFHALACAGRMTATVAVVDGFESFEWSQYYPFHHLVAVEKGSDFFIYFNDIELRRKGRMTDYQRRKREQLERSHGPPPPDATARALTDLLSVVIPREGEIRIHSDDHPAYRRPIRLLGSRVRHFVTSGKLRRSKHNPLWEVNLLDLLIRHGSSNHKRETIAWSKRRQCSAERLAILLVWRNYIKGRTERLQTAPTPAMVRGLFDRPLQVVEILSQRYFPARIGLPRRWREYYAGSVETRALPNNRSHQLVYAY